ncbi:glutamyl-tRNA amidotransferase (plasmid) [Acinetobacter sp. NCu2D-2]|uniref:amidase n=1 Tax=Acinetobacter sp. NCu2D-2 TaxID=1608473 RepID=UPI0007CDEF90|nr:amidase [Acinetobacter sp. NCu2D-2]ANF83379.1 glutamyl-tRNA amidotransferase [Acinetobacter sp. NCu2D-2]
MNSVYKTILIGSGRNRVVIKDSIDIEGLQTTLGSCSLLDVAPATENAEVITHLLQHDCQIVGKAVMHELAYGITGINQHFGTPTNPKYPELIPGGSSSGSATAVAENIADFSLGTDTGGSVRMPAACCGVFGLKPSFGRVSRIGVHPRDTSLDCVGPFANSVEKIELAMQCIDPSFTPVSTPDHGPRLAMLNVDAEAVVISTLEAILQDAEIQYEVVDAPSLKDAFDAGMHVINYETWQAFGHLTETGKIADDVQQRLLKASQTTSDQVEKANLVREKFRKEIDDLLNQFDAICLPTLPQIPPKVVDAANTVAFLNLTALVRPFNLSGHPAITIPYETAQGLPVGLQLVTKHNADEQLCAIAKYISDATKSAQGARS